VRETLFFLWVCRHACRLSQQFLPARFFRRRVFFPFLSVLPRTDLDPVVPSLSLLTLPPRSLVRDKPVFFSLPSIPYGFFFHRLSLFASLDGARGFGPFWPGTPRWGRTFLFQTFVAQSSLASGIRNLSPFSFVLALHRRPSPLAYPYRDPHLFFPSRCLLFLKFFSISVFSYWRVLFPSIMATFSTAKNRLLQVSCLTTVFVFSHHAARSICKHRVPSSSSGQNLGHCSPLFSHFCRRQASTLGSAAPLFF